MTHTYSSARQHFYSSLGTIVIGAALALIPTVAAYAHSDTKPRQTGTGVEVVLGANGSALVRGAKVTNVSDTTVNATTNYGSSQLSWTIKTDSDTEFVSHEGEGERNDIVVGDTISFRGMIDQAVAGLTVHANVIKDWSQIETKRTVSGFISSINASLDSFVVSHGNTSTEIQTDSETKFKVNGEDGTFASLFTDAKVRIAGMFNASSSIFTASEVSVASSTKKHAFRGWLDGSFWTKFWDR